MDVWGFPWCSYNIMEDYKKPALGEGPFYTDYYCNFKQARPDLGIDKIDWRESRYTYLAEHKEDLITLFEEVFQYREIGQETESRFQEFLQRHFDEIADKYNHAYKVTEENDVDKLGTGYSYKEIRDRTTKVTGTSTNTETRNNKYKDTPATSTSTINNPTSENIDDRESSGNANTNEILSDKISRDNTKHDKEMIEELSDLINKYRQIDVEFVNDFGVCFIGLLQ